ncbi:MAG: hypothetical protein Q8Q69_03230, partial [Nitrosopumilaceae archaeon]|nr:hypothetical protein [Nitrosopumilaceae archaeon]
YTAQSSGVFNSGQWYRLWTYPNTNVIAMHGETNIIFLATSSIYVTRAGDSGWNATLTPQTHTMYLRKAYNGGTKLEFEYNTPYTDTFTFYVKIYYVINGGAIGNEGQGDWGGETI